MYFCSVLCPQHTCILRREQHHLFIQKYQSITHTHTTWPHCNTDPLQLAWIHPVSMQQKLPAPAVGDARDSWQPGQNLSCPCGCFLWLHHCMSLHSIRDPKTCKHTQSLPKCCLCNTKTTETENKTSS